MKKILFLGFLILIFSCDDGNFETPSFNFDDAPIENCGNLILYKVNDSEVLLLELDEDNTDNAFFKTEKEDIPFSLNDKIYYRTYDASIPNGFFCNAVPPSSPKLNREWIGSGTLIVNNTITENDDGTFTYVATFKILDMNLSNSNGNSIVFDTYDFGVKTGTFQ